MPRQAEDLDAGRRADESLARFTGRAQRLLDETVRVAHDAGDVDALGSVSAYYCNSAYFIDPDIGGHIRPRISTGDSPGVTGGCTRQGACAGADQEHPQPAQRCRHCRGGL